MRSIAVTIGIVVAVLFAGAALAEHHEVTVQGKVACAKCTLKAEGATDCQDVLVVKGEDGTETHYYLVNNEVLETFGHTCQGHKPAMVRGTVEEKDGKLWLTAAHMDAPGKSEGKGHGDHAGHDG